jgi:hypothetical protein
VPGRPAREPEQRPIRIGNCSGFYGDRLAAMHEMLTGGPLDVLTGDYLAELTMLILFRSRGKDPTKGYATTFLRQLEANLGTALDRRVRIVVNAGGLNPAGCADAVRSLAGRLGLEPNVAHVEGDDVLPLFGGSVTANAYLGAFPLAAGLAGGADIVISGRCTDAALVCGPAAWWHGWSAEQLDELAGAVVAGHVLECGTQATGGNYAFFREVPNPEHLGFPLAEIHADGSSVITKHPGTGGMVSRGTVTAQLLYEIGAPAYLGPDVTAHFDTIRLEEQGPDRVRLAGVRGSPPPPTIKVATNRLGGFRNSVNFLLCGLDIEDKADLLRRQLAASTAGIAEVTETLTRLDRPDADTEEGATAVLRVQVRDQDPAKVGRAFSGPAIELALASIPGFHVTAPPGEASPFGVYAPAFLTRDQISPVVVHQDGRRTVISPGPLPATPPGLGPAHLAAEPAAPVGGPTERVPLGTILGARSGDKGGDANLGVWARTDAAYGWLAHWLTVDRLRELLPETAGLEIHRYAMANLLAVNFVLVGLLGAGVAASTRFDPQAKALGEWLRGRRVEIPKVLL